MIETANVHFILRKKRAWWVTRLLLAVSRLLSSKPDGWWVWASVIYPPTNLDDSPNWGTPAWCDSNGTGLVYSLGRVQVESKFGPVLGLWQRYPVIPIFSGLVVATAVVGGFASQLEAAIVFGLLLCGLFLSFGPLCWPRWRQDRLALHAVMHHEIESTGMPPDLAAIWVAGWSRRFVFSSWPWRWAADDLYADWVACSKLAEHP